MKCLRLEVAVFREHGKVATAVDYLTLGDLTQSTFNTGNFKLVYVEIGKGEHRITNELCAIHSDLSTVSLSLTATSFKVVYLTFKLLGNTYISKKHIFYVSLL